MKPLAISLALGAFIGVLMFVSMKLGRSLEATDNQIAWDCAAAAAQQDAANAATREHLAINEHVRRAYVVGRGHGYDLALRLQKGQFRTGPSNAVDWAAVSSFEQARLLNYQIENALQRYTNTGRLIAITNLTNVAGSPNTHPPVAAKSEMPPGWKLQTDGKEWRWLDALGAGWVPLKTREEAISNAWRHFNYKAPDWKDAQP